MNGQQRSFLGAAIVLAIAIPGHTALGQSGNATEGRRLAVSICSKCHLVPEAQPTSAMDAAPTFTTLANDPAMTNERLRRFLIAPHSQMPPIVISRTEVEDLIAYMRTLGRASR